MSEGGPYQRLFSSEAEKGKIKVEVVSEDVTMKKAVMMIMAVLILSSVATANLVNLDWNVTGFSAGTFSGTPAPVLGLDGDTWNGDSVSYGSEGQSVDSGMLVDSTGSVTGVSVQINQINNAYDLTGNDGNVDGNWKSLMLDYLYLYSGSSQNAAVITISGLVASSNYELVLFGANTAGQGSAFTIDGVTKTTSDTGTISTALVDGDEYVFFTGTASAAGTVVIDWTIPGSFAGFNGLQIEGQFVPEPATMLLFGLGSLGLLRCKRG